MWPEPGRAASERRTADERRAAAGCGLTLGLDLPPERRASILAKPNARSAGGGATDDGDRAGTGAGRRRELVRQDTRGVRPRVVAAREQLGSVGGGVRGRGLQRVDAGLAGRPR